MLTDSGVEKIEAMLREAELLKAGTLYDIHNVALVHHANQALRAHKLFARDTDYIVKDGKVVIIDEFTGRMMEGRRYSEGLHQALEAKESVEIQAENQTLASITFQNYFRLYPKLAGMTGTAMTEAEEFSEIYKLDSVEMPTNVPMQRVDNDDEVYRTAREKYEAIIAQVLECQQRKQPVLAGTVSIEKSEALSALLKKRKIPHQVLNARYHEQEAYIIAQAGRPGAVTIATNMAGRGTDIQLGGNLERRLRQELGAVTDEADRARRTAEIRAEIDAAREAVRRSGGLFVVGSERHESRRIDNQLRGRSGRQGDPGASKFFVSLEDDLMRIFGSQRMDGMLKRLGLKEGEAIFHPWINKALEKAQSKVEARNFDIRKNLLKFDNVMNDQRKVVFEQRVEWMRDENVAETVTEMRHSVIEELLATHVPKNAYPEQWDTAGLKEQLKRVLGVELPVDDWAKEEGIGDEEILSRVERRADEHMAAKVAKWGPDVIRYIEKSILLQTLDHLWREHLLTLEHLRQVIGLRGYGQRDPLNEYKSEAFHAYETMSNRLREAVTAQLMRVEILEERPPASVPDEAPVLSVAPAPPLPAMRAHKVDPMTGEDEMALAEAPAGGALAGAGAERLASAAVRNPNDPKSWGKVGRNEPCPCGSGKKYKHCHGRFA